MCQPASTTQTHTCTHGDHCASRTLVCSNTSNVISIPLYTALSPILSLSIQCIKRYSGYSVAEQHGCIFLQNNHLILKFLMSKGGGHQPTHPPSRVCTMKRFWWVVVIKELARNAKGYCPPYYTLRQFGAKKCNWVVC